MKSNTSTLIIRSKAISLLSAAIMAISACGSSTNSTNSSDSVSTDTATAQSVVKPSGPKPDWAPGIKPEMQAVIEKLASFNDKPIPELSPAEARKNHTPTDAVMALIEENNITIPPPMVDTSGQKIPVSGGNIHARIYTPKGEGPFPVIVYYHGGGFVIADLDVYDASASAIAEQANAVVVSVAYRMGPEHKFPTAHMDSFAAYEWVTKNAASIKGDPEKIAVAGESAGGNLAVNMAIMARDKSIKMPLHILAVYPIAQSDMNTASYKKYATAKPLDKPMMEWFTKHYLNNISEAKDPKISLVNAKLDNLPPVTIITAEIDPLQSDGMMLADKLKAAGVTVNTKNYDGVTHEFFGMAAIVPEAKDAQRYAVEQLKKALQ
ncbi:alpha/beta hydrolase fold domain-containing protein [Daejeonella sp.]|uniref:alpha/beta hydrolase n=1 Tax=Daejeonella sp. TaxID=2805397 RepID=UPI0039837E94